jgi:UDP-N-acetylglucosamine--N-acetylmuramyl-(pentapeptide) pyrophosphoryl-undecaprenol N-acetylglucosamine transferase
VIPALALAEAYARLAGTLEIRFFAAGEGAGHRLLERAGYPVHFIPGSQIARTTRLEQCVAVGRLVHGVARARKTLIQHRTRLVIGTGGYGSAGAIVAARSLGLATALIEPNVTPGLANRILGRITHRSWVGFEQTAGFFPHHRTVVTGVPLRRGVANVTSRQPPVLPRLRVLVLSGSRGEAFLGERIPALAQALGHAGLSVEVRHQGGEWAGAIQQAYDKLRIQACVEGFIEDMAGALAWADLAIARAGAGTIAELAAAGVPMLLVPLADAAHDHQASNASALASRDAALMVREEQWETDALARQILGLVRHADAWTTMARTAQGLSTPDATTRIIQDCEALMVGRW